MTLFRILGAIGIVLLGAALAIAPILAIGDRMTTVAALGIAGIAFLLAAWAVRKIATWRRPRAGEDPATSSDTGPPPAHGRRSDRQP